MSGVSVITSETEPLDPPINCLIVNTTGTLNQYFCWAGEFTSIGVPGSPAVHRKGEPVPDRSARRGLVGHAGRREPVDPSVGHHPEAGA